MSYSKRLAIVIGILVVAFLAYYAFSVYLVSRLDGTGGVHAPADSMLQYSSEEGVTFQYPNSYKLSSAPNTVNGYTWDSLELIDKNYVPAQNSEGPTAISMSIFPNPENVPLETWIKTDARSNYQYSQDGTFTKGSIGGQASEAYQYSGLYENDVAAISYKGKIFLFSDSWSQTVDPIRQDFNKVLSSVQFQ